MSFLKPDDVLLFSALEQRVSKLEMQTQIHKHELHELHTTSKELSDALHQISTALQQIKWTCLGAGVMYVAGQLGIVDTLKLFIG
jgi:hypothetical protein